MATSPAALPPVFKCFKLTSDGENTYGFRMLNEIIVKLKYSKEENRKDLKWSSSPWWRKTNGKTNTKQEDDFRGISVATRISVKKL
ncbi:hypothetical protein L2E82_01389 [Cichorium intybus]|uniref:Uncharacterized protein n=1 Tax=Cichorium intybus TaxID=13427 RepID=A0ACB9GYS9_CICIN|nr:hypothetical protein L2E82_01389 [Cichorium intybus]